MKLFLHLLLVAGSIVTGLMCALSVQPSDPDLPYVSLAEHPFGAFVFSFSLVYMAGLVVMFAFNMAEKALRNRKAKILSSIQLNEK